MEWLSSSEGFNAGHLGFAIGIHVFEGIFAFKLARDKNLNLMSCIFWFVQTLIIGVGSFEVNFIIVFVRLPWIHRYCVSMKLPQIQRNKIISNHLVLGGGFFYLVSGLSLVVQHIPLITPFLQLLTVRTLSFLNQYNQVIRNSGNLRCCELVHQCNIICNSMSYFWRYSRRSYC